MRQRMIIALAAVGLLTAIVAGPALAGAGGVQRYQVATTSYTLSVLDAFTHTFVVTLNPCDESIAITGSTPLGSGYYTTETVVGMLTSGVISFSATYDGPYSSGFAWSGSFPVAGGPLSGQYTGTVTAAPTTFSSYKNHGQFVSSMGGGPEGAHSCIGKPIKSEHETLSNAGTEGVEAAKAKDKAAQWARLLAKFEALLARLNSSNGTSAIQKHIDRISTESAAKHPDHQKKPKLAKKPASSASVKDHSNHGNHSGKPKP
jgi:hypothetical protein